MTETFLNMLYQVYLKLLMNFSCMHIIYCLQVCNKVEMNITRYINVWNLLVNVIVININIIIISISFVLNNHLCKIMHLKIILFMVPIFQLCDGLHIIVKRDLNTPNALSTYFFVASWHFVNNFLFSPYGIGLVFTNVTQSRYVICKMILILCVVPLIVNCTRGAQSYKTSLNMGD